MDTWVLDEAPFIHHVACHLSEDDVKCTVHEFFLPSGSWNFHKLVSSLPKSLCKKLWLSTFLDAVIVRSNKIMAIHIPRHI